MSHRETTNQSSIHDPEVRWLAQIQRLLESMEARLIRMEQAMIPTKPDVISQWPPEAALGPPGASQTHSDPCDHQSTDPGPGSL
jgi:hypothetical protein